MDAIRNRLSALRYSDQLSELTVRRTALFCMHVGTLIMSKVTVEM
jgi:hypothetical protein